MGTKRYYSVIAALNQRQTLSIAARVALIIAWFIVVASIIVTAVHVVIS